MQKHRFRVLVPQEFQQAFYVTASSEQEAIAIVALGAHDAVARAAHITWCESEFVSSMDPDSWEVEPLHEPLPQDALEARGAPAENRHDNNKEQEPRATANEAQSRTLYYDGLPVPNHPRIELVTTRLTTRVAEPGPSICEPADIGKLLCDLIGNRDREVAVAVHLDQTHKVVSVDVLSVGTLNAALVHPREVFKGAILANARAIIFGHNHPSGDLTPSAHDAAVTKQLAEAGTIIGIPLLDSLIVNREDYRSVDAMLPEKAEQVWRAAGMRSGVDISQGCPERASRPSDVAHHLAQNASCYIEPDDIYVDHQEARLTLGLTEAPVIAAEERENAPAP